MRETRVRACGREWVIPAEPSVGMILKFRDWCAGQLGDPFEGLETLAKCLPKEEMVALIKEARDTKQQLKCFSLTCEVAQRFLKTEAGGLKFTELLLRDAYPDMTDAEVREVTLAYGEQLAQHKASEGNGRAPAPAVERAGA